MKTSLIDIKEHIRKYLQIITTVMNVDVGVVDKNMVRVSGTGLYENIEGRLSTGKVFKSTLETGESYIIEDPKSHPLCLGCGNRLECREVLEISTPIYSNGEIEGVIGLVCFNEEQKEKIIKDIKSYLNLTKQIAEFIGMKYKEYKEDLLQKDREETLSQILNNMTKGVIVVDEENKILSINQDAMKKLKLGQNLLNHKLKLISQNDSLMNEEVFKMVINKKEYLVAGKYIPLISLSQKKTRAFIFDDIQKINQNILDLTNQYNIITIDDIHGVSEKILSMKEYIKIVSKSSSTVLITGESGTGKELIARALHSSGFRKTKPFVVINCAAIPDSLLESELFGYVKGAFTGASNNGHIGKFELANSGVIFLDEIGDMPMYLQTKLLRVIQEKKIERIGSNKSIDLDIKIIAATNADLKEKIREKKFREDLYYRLNVIPIKTYPLRERKEDIPLLVEELIEKYNNISEKSIEGVSEEALKVIMKYNWPGNVRELENAIEFAINTSEESKVILASMLPQNINNDNIEKVVEEIKYREINQGLLEEDFEEIEKLYILRGLEKYGGSTEGKKIISEKMNIGLTTLYRKLKKYNID